MEASLTQSKIQSQKPHQHENSQTHDTFSLLVEDPSHQQLPFVLARTFTRLSYRTFFSHLIDLTQEQQKYKNNLALSLAKRMPPAIRNQVVKMVKYYEGHMSDQLKTIHLLVEENRKLKHQVEEQEEKENCPVLENRSNGEKSDKERIVELEECLISKNKNILGLNKEITQLLAKLKKYKKRVYQLESKSKSPVKSVSSQLY